MRATICQRWTRQLANILSLLWQSWFRATQFEELGSRGSQLLAGFHQELELFRRPPLNKMSKVLVSIIENNQNERLRGYVQAGCRHFSSDAHVTIKLHNFIQGLNKNIEQARKLLEDLEHIVDNVTAIMQKSTNLLLECINIPTQDNSSEGSLGSENEEGSLLHGSAHRLEISDYMAMMSVIYGMLRQDYIMQEKVVSALQLDTPSEILESYHLMWTLRPFVDERVFNEALNWT